MNDLERRNAVDPITLEVLRNALESIADEMGAVLKRTSFSPNIKERMDASCAIFDAQAQLVAQAEHVPVHLGSMLRSVEATVAAVGAVEDGDVVIVNDPFTNGSHLPDITVVAPVFVDRRHIAYVATRAHHADVGGMEPGSMPGNSQEIYQEGLVIPAVRLYRRGELQDDVMRMILANVRTPEERRGDLNAQLASLRAGEQRIRELAGRYRTELVTAGFAAILDYAERRMRRRLAEFPPGTYRADPEIPVNAGTFRNVELRIPEGSFLAARPPAATCAGNTETTQRVADTVLKVCAQFAPDRVPAASQGTMNTIAVGGNDPRDGRPYSYIETIGGGQGGRPMGPGDDGIQCNMTNTMNTPVEALEITYPLRVERYELREGSAGTGKHRGGNGLVRAIRSVGHTARVSLQCERRRFAPYGLQGGADGQPGRNYVMRRDGAIRDEPGKASLSLGPDEIIVVETPGGGGWGAP